LNILYALDDSFHFEASMKQMRSMLLGPLMCKLMRGPLFFVTDSFIISLSTCSTLFAKSVYRKSVQPMLRKNVLVLAIRFKNKLKIHFSIH